MVVLSEGFIISLLLLVEVSDFIKVASEVFCRKIVKGVASLILSLLIDILSFLLDISLLKGISDSLEFLICQSSSLLDKSRNIVTRRDVSLGGDDQLGLLMSIKVELLS